MRESAPGRCTVGVLVCTWHRPMALARCVAALRTQSRAPDEILVAYRGDDDDSATMVAALQPGLRAVVLDEPGVVAARNAGLRAGRCAVQAQIDDDTEPHPEWCARLAARFEVDPRLGGLCGRDRVHDGGGFDEVPARRVGVLQWWGRLVGNHHRGRGEARAVDFLKGANMAFRAAAVRGLAFDPRLRGAGAQPHEDVAFSLAVRRRGWRLLYDPAVLVDHHAGRAEARPYSSVGGAADLRACRESGYNMVVALWDELGACRRGVFLAWSVLVGTGPEPGLAQALRYTPRAGWGAWRRCAATLAGKMEATRDLLRGRGAPGRPGTWPAAPPPGPAGVRCASAS